MSKPLPPKKPKVEKTTKSVYGPTALWVRMGEIASKNDRSKSELIVGILEKWLEEHEGKRRR